MLISRKVSLEITEHSAYRAYDDVGITGETLGDNENVCNNRRIAVKSGIHPPRIFLSRCAIRSR